MKEVTTYFEVVKDNIRTFYKTRQLLRSRQEIRDYCCIQGIDIPCISLILTFIISYGPDHENLRAELI